MVEVGGGTVGFGDAVRHPAGQEPSGAFPRPVERVLPLLDRGGVLVACLLGGEVQGLGDVIPSAAPLAGVDHRRTSTSWAIETRRAAWST